MDWNDSKNKKIKIRVQSQQKVYWIQMFGRIQSEL